MSSVRIIGLALVGLTLFACQPQNAIVASVTPTRLCSSANIRAIEYANGHVHANCVTHADSNRDGSRHAHAPAVLDAGYRRERPGS